MNSSYNKIATLLIAGISLIASNQLRAQTLNNARKLPASQTTTSVGYGVVEGNTPRWVPPTVPATASFAGEAVPLNRFEVRERLDREMLVNNYYHGATFYILKLMPRYFPLIERILKENGVPDDFKYLCVAESALQNQRSSAGAQGFWQFLSATGRQFGMEVDGDIDERDNVEKATRGACQYLKLAYNKFGTWTAAAASYNCGMGGYNGYSTYQGFTNYYELLLPEETNRYVFRIIALKIILENPQQYGFFIEESQRYQPIPTRTVAVTIGISNLADWAKANGTTYKMVRLLNPWIQGKSISSSSSRTYYIQVPTNK